MRLAHAAKYREAAELVATEAETAPASASVGAGLAVLAGIAAADAACCAALGRRSRGQNHQQALGLLAAVEPGGVDAARDLERMLDLKDTAHYGVIHMSSAELRRALRRASQLMEFAQRVLAR
ncbi:MAG: hypothetical protein ACRDT2_17770 [Natronosporangium sp.]